MKKWLSNNKGISAIGLILVVVLLVMLFGSYPGYSYSHNWGYAPFGGFGLILVILVVLLLVGAI
jgi:uncharacterized membrane protein